MNGTDLQLVCCSTFCKQYIDSMYPYKTFRQFFLALYSTQIYHCFRMFFNEAYCQDLVTRATL